MALGIYVSVPFCRTKCSYCNFASDVFSRSVFERYIDRVCAEIANAENTAVTTDARLEREVDSIYLGGGTPTVLEPAQLERMFAVMRQHFSVRDDAEITVECAPGTLNADLLNTLLHCGVNRVSLGVQSFVDAEAAAAGRLHKRQTVFDDIAKLRTAGIPKINIDLIAGLPHQTAMSWQNSLSEAISTGVPHASIYMLEIDEDSRLGRELIAGGSHYHAHFVPDEDATADFYLMACETLETAGVIQYEISNFARPGFESRHNLKYWTRQPYLGFGIDAHSMVHSVRGPAESVRLATPDSLENYLAGLPVQKTIVTSSMALEEQFFLGLRLNHGVDLSEIRTAVGVGVFENVRSIVDELVNQALLERDGEIIRLTARGRLLSNEVFQRFLASTATINVSV